MFNFDDPKLPKSIDKKHYWQIRGCMMITNSLSWYFVSYDPRFKDKNHQLLIHKIDRNEEDIEKLRYRLDEAILRKLERIDYLQGTFSKAG